MLSANELHRVTDRPHEATDQPHQARVGVFGFNTPYFTHLCAQTNVLPRSQAPAQLFTILGSGNEEPGEREHVLGVSICPVSTVSKWLTVSKWWTIPTLNRKELEMQRSELLWSLSGTHAFFFFRLSCHCRVQQSFNLVNVLISKFFTGQTDRLTD